MKAPSLEMVLVDYLSEKEVLKNEDENIPGLGKQWAIVMAYFWDHMMAYLLGNHY